MCSVVLTSVLPGHVAPGLDLLHQHSCGETGQRSHQQVSWACRSDSGVRVEKIGKEMFFLGLFACCRWNLMLKWTGVLFGRSCFLLSCRCRLLLFYEVLPALHAWLGVCEREADIAGGFCCMCILITVSYLIGSASVVSPCFCASGVLLTTCVPTR